jgi:hypothetical protein
VIFAFFRGYCIFEISPAEAAQVFNLDAFAHVLSLICGGLL